MIDGLSAWFLAAWYIRYDYCPTPRLAMRRTLRS